MIMPFLEPEISKFSITINDENIHGAFQVKFWPGPPNVSGLPSIIIMQYCTGKLMTTSLFNVRVSLALFDDLTFHTMSNHLLSFLLKNA